MSNSDNYDRAERAIMAVFGDTSVPASETKENLRALADSIELMLESVGDDDE